MKRTESYPYDINVTFILNRYEELVVEQPDERYRNMLSEVQLQVQALCESLELDYAEHMAVKFPIIVPSTSNTHPVFLLHRLLLIDVNKISSFLDYQLQTFEGNYYAKDKQSFVRLVEHTIYDRASRFVSVNHERRLKLIMHWIMRRNLKAQESSTAYQDKMVRLNEKYIPEIFDLLSPYFSESDRPYLKLLLAGEPIEKKIVFLGEATMLLMSFRILCDKQVVLVPKRALQYWLKHYFLVVGTSDKTNLPINKEYAHKIISTNKSPNSRFIKGFENISVVPSI